MYSIALGCDPQFMQRSPTPFKKRSMEISSACQAPTGEVEGLFPNLREVVPRSGGTGEALEKPPQSACKVSPVLKLVKVPIAFKPIGVTIKCYQCNFNQSQTRKLVGRCESGSTVTKCSSPYSLRASERWVMETIGLSSYSFPRQRERSKIRRQYQHAARQ